MSPVMILLYEIKEVIKMNKINRIKELVKLLNKASDAYYVNDKPIMSDKEYDKLYDELEMLEKETDYILSTSVTHKVQGKVLDGFQKVTHSKPMLSAAKTKDVNEIKKFAHLFDDCLTLKKPPNLNIYI